MQVKAIFFEDSSGLKQTTGFALFLVMSLLFVASNHAAYDGYFQDDELGALGWAPIVPAAGFGRALLSPFFQTNNFRPVAHFYFHVMGRYFALDFPKYVIPIQAIHLINVLLVWLLARQFGATAFAASAGCLFFGFHMASFDIYWKPMYVFDLLCGTFCLLSLLFYTQRRIVLSFIAFWLAYKSKELAVMLPFVLALYEFWFGKRRWLELIPFFLVSLSFGLQGMFLNPNVDNPYTFRFTLRALETTSRFYSSNILLFHHAGFVVVPLGLWLGKPNVRFGIITMLVFMVPLAFLPGRLFAAYCYVPLIGLTLAVTGLIRRKREVAALMFLVFWVGWNYNRLNKEQSRALAIADENRAYVSGLADFVRTSPETRSFIYDGRPSAFAPWGILGALQYLHHSTDIQLTGIGDPSPAENVVSIGILKWDQTARRLNITMRN